MISRFRRLSVPPWPTIPPWPAKCAPAARFFATSARFKNSDFVQYAESFGARGYRVESAAQLIPVLDEALHCGTVAVIDCPVDYAQNMQLTERLAALQCPV